MRNNGAKAMQKKRKSRWWIGMAVAIIALLVLLAAFLYIHNIPALDRLIPTNSSSLQATILNPLNGSYWPCNYNIPVYANAWSKAPIETLAFYVNGTLYDTITPSSPDETDFFATWRWQPGQEGKYLLSVTATDTNGATRNSDPVLITAGSAHTTASPKYPQADDTLASLAEQSNSSLEQIIDLNPGIDPSQALDPQTPVYVPNDPIPISNPNLIPPLEDMSTGGNGAEPPGNSAPDESGSLNGEWGFLDNLKFYWNTQKAAKATGEDTSIYAPLKPMMATNYKGCTTELKIYTSIYEDSKYSGSNSYSNDPRCSEEGFFIYRSRNGGDYERVATFPAYHGGEDESGWTLWDENQFGDMLYYASAFNEFGETAGTPMALSLNQNDCTDPQDMANPNEIRVDPQGNLLLPYNLDTAYLYIRIGDSAAVRVPEGDRFFLPNSGVLFNLRDYFDSISDELQTPDLEADLEVWGWLSGQLIYAGKYQYELHHTVLSVCSQEGEGTCASGMGEWTNEMTILPNSVIPLKDQKYDIRWRSTGLSKVNKICLSITPKGYYGDGLTESTNVLLFECYWDSGAPFEGGYEGTYTLDFSKLLYPEDISNIPIYTGKSGENYQDVEFQNKYPPGTPFTLSIRVLPVLDSQYLKDISNTVLMHHETAFAPPGGPPLQSEYASMYDVEILQDSYQAPQYEIWSKWACVIVDYDPTGQFSPGQEVCPMSYVECGVNVDCDGFWDVLGAGWDYIVNLIDDAKGEIAGAVAKTIPGCEGSSACQGVIRAGVDYGAYALTGIPPDLPTFDDLATQGAAEFIVEGLSGISGEDVSYICGDSCKTEIANQLKPYIEQAKSYYSQPGCMDAGGHYGMFPFCFPPPAKVHPVPGAFDYPGYISVKVTRKDTPESLNVSPAEVQGKIKLFVTGTGKNDQRVGYYGKECYYVDNIPQSDLPDPNHPNSLANSYYFYLGDEPMDEPLYHDFSIEIPWLEPGESITLPVKLDQVGWFVESNCITTAKNQYLYFKGTSDIEASEYCYSSDSSWSWVPCQNGGHDSWVFANPQAP
jgi:hypothetical protein